MAGSGIAAAGTATHEIHNDDVGHPERIGITTGIWVGAIVLTRIAEWWRKRENERRERDRQLREAIAAQTEMIVAQVETIAAQTAILERIEKKL
jgi:hypothetical protein